MLKVLFLNDATGDVVTGNYQWKVMINDTILEKGKLANHKRSSGWQGLLRKFVRENCKTK